MCMCVCMYTIHIEYKAFHPLCVHRKRKISFCPTTMYSNTQPMYVCMVCMYVCMYTYFPETAHR